MCKGGTFFGVGMGVGPGMGVTVTVGLGVAEVGVGGALGGVVGAEFDTLEIELGVDDGPKDGPSALCCCLSVVFEYNLLVCVVCNPRNALIVWVDGMSARVEPSPTGVAAAAD